MHPARAVPFATLRSNLYIAKSRGLVSEQKNGNLRLYCYTRKTVYKKLWNETTSAARGLIINSRDKKVVATPFVKFFNVGENSGTIPNSKFDVYEKLDGSLIIIYWDDGWKTATKGSFFSEQAKWAANYINKLDLTILEKGTTYLAEAVYPENRIVVPYATSRLVLLAAYDCYGNEVPCWNVRYIAQKIGLETAKLYQYDSISDLLSKAKELPSTEEGFVIRFVDGTRLKVKGEEYLRIHRLISECTPLAVWRSMVAGDNTAKVRKELPEEFWDDYDCITSTLKNRYEDTIRIIEDEAGKLANLSDKEVGLMLPSLSEGVRRFIFQYRKKPNWKESVLKDIRPDGNILPGYVPNSGIRRVLGEI